MKAKNFLKIFGTTFIICLLFISAIVHFLPGVAAENKKQALIETLSQSQRESGDFPSFWGGMALSGNLGWTIEALLTLDATDGLNNVNLTKASEYINQQLYTFNELYWSYLAVTASKFLNLELNATFIENVLERYSQQDGAFYELYISAFPIDFKSQPLAQLAYTQPNMITTFLAVSILNELDVLDRINITQTLEWTLLCKAENSGFKPFPTSSNTSSPFVVDDKSANLPSTYCAVSVLKILNYTFTDEAKKSIKNYVLSCQDNIRGYFLIHPTDKNYTNVLYYTYYGVATLRHLDVLKDEDAKKAISKAEVFVLNQQELSHNNEFPIPTRGSQTYGLFHLPNKFGTTTASHYAVSTLKEASTLSLLNMPTERAITTRFYLFILFLSIAGIACGIASAILTVKRYNQHPSEKQPSE